MYCTDYFMFRAMVDRAYDMHRHKTMKEFGLSGAEVDILLFLANNPELNTATDIVQKRKLSKSHASLAIHSLLEKGLIIGTSEEGDHKKIHLHLQEDAKKITEYGQREQEEFIGNVFGNLSEEEARILDRCISKMTVSLQEHYGK